MFLSLRLFKGPELDQGHTKDPVVVCVLGVMEVVLLKSINTYITSHKILTAKHARKRQIIWEI